MDAKQQVMDALFTRLSMAYLDRFTRQFQAGAETDATIEAFKEAWSAEFRRCKLTIPQVMWAIEQFPSRHPDYPPTLGQFVALCRVYQPIKPPSLPAPREKMSSRALALREQIRNLTRRLTNHE